MIYGDYGDLRLIRECLPFNAKGDLKNLYSSPLNFHNLPNLIVIINFDICKIIIEERISYVGTNFLLF